MKPKTTLPRIFVFRAVVSLLVLVFIVSFWLFYGVHLIEDSSKIKYADIVQFALSLIDALLFVHYLAIILIELRHWSPSYYVKVVRSPDGQSASYSLGDLSIQRAAAQILEKYYVDFPTIHTWIWCQAAELAKRATRCMMLMEWGTEQLMTAIQRL